jgi:FtsH-binding integral membrane protein
MEENIATTSDSNFKRKTINSKGKTLAIWGTILQFPLLISLIYSINKLNNTFQMMLQFFGSAEPKILAGVISIAVDQIVIGCLFSIPGLLISLYVILKTNYRSKWFFIFNMITYVFWVLSIIVLIYFTI